jgi:PPOX class probable F420-dependent enzyme
VEIPAAAARRLLESTPLGRLSTLGPDASPVAVPIVYVLLGDELWSPIDGKPKSGSELARVRNVRRDPRVCVLVDDYAEDWGRLWWIRVDGRARVETAEAGANALAGLRRKYPQYATVPLLDQSATLLVIRIAQVSTWCATANAWSDA